MDDKKVKEFYNSINQHLTFLNDVDLNADGDATVKLITSTINKYSNSEFIKFCVDVINSISKNEYEFCRKLFEISCALVKYRRDPDGHEIVMTPLLLIRVGEGDCKKFTTWICAVLKCKGIESASKVVNYDSSYGWQHIYAIAWPKKDNNTVHTMEFPGFIVLDPVNNERFNEEVKYRVGRINFYDGTYSKLIMAKLSMMGNAPGQNEKFFGLGAADEILGDLEDISGRKRHRVTAKCIQGLEDEYIHGTSYDSIEGAPDDDEAIAAKKNPAKAQKKAAKKVERKEKHVKRVEKRKVALKKVKKVGFEPVRAAFLGLILLGGALEKTHLKINLAKKLAQLWMTDNGASLKALWAKFGGKEDALKKAIIKASHIQISGIGTPLAAAASLIAAASPILILTVKLLHDKKQIAKNEALRTIDATDQTVDQVVDNNGNLKDVSSLLKEGGKLIDEVVKIDQGGDKQAQDLIKTTSTTNDPNPTAPPTNDGGKDEPKASGFSLTNASSYFTGSITTQLMGVAAGHETIGAITGITLFAIGTFLIIKKSFFKTI